MSSWYGCLLVLLVSVSVLPAAASSLGAAKGAPATPEQQAAKLEEDIQKRLGVGEEVACLPSIKELADVMMERKSAQQELASTGKLNPYRLWLDRKITLLGEKQDALFFPLLTCLQAKNIMTPSEKMLDSVMPYDAEWLIETAEGKKKLWAMMTSAGFDLGSVFRKEASEMFDKMVLANRDTVLKGVKDVKGGNWWEPVVKVEEFPVPALSEFVLDRRYSAGVRGIMTCDVDLFVPLPEKFLEEKTEKAVDSALRRHEHHFENKYPQWALFDKRSETSAGVERLLDVFHWSDAMKRGASWKREEERQKFEKAEDEGELARAMLKKRMVQDAFGKTGALEFIRRARDKGLKPGGTADGLGSEFLQSEVAKMIGRNDVVRVVGDELDRLRAEVSDDLRALTHLFSFSRTDVWNAIVADATKKKGPWEKLGFYPEVIEKSYTHPPEIPEYTGGQTCHMDDEGLENHYCEAYKNYFFLVHPRWKCMTQEQMRVEWQKRSSMVPQLRKK